MARPHIEFVQSQRLPWERPYGPGSRADVEARVLSRDAETGAASLLARFPAGYAASGTHWLEADEELFVVDGELVIGDVVYGRYAYAHLPAGYPRRGVASGPGALVLAFVSSEPVERADATPDYDPRRLVEKLDTLAMSGESGPRKHMGSEGFDHTGTVHKPLWLDPDTGERSWLIALAPGWSTTKAETHPVAEEEFALSGDICLTNGVMHAGGYFWRPPGIRHGPFGTVAGTLHFCRGRGGAFSTVFEDRPEALDWNPAYRPFLPPDYAARLSGTHADPLAATLL